MRFLRCAILCLLAASLSAQTVRTKQLAFKCATGSRLSGAAESIMFMRCSDGKFLQSTAGSAFAEVALGTVGNATTAGLFSARPGSATAGDLYFVTDGATVQRWTGAWSAYGPLWQLAAVPTSGWSWVNQDGATVDESRDHFYLEYTATAATAGDNVALRCRTAPATPYTITAALIPNNLRTTSGATIYMYLGLAFRESATSKLESWFVVTNPFVSGTIWTSVSLWSSATSLSSELTRFYTTGKQIWWLRVNADGTNLKYYLSHDGLHFHLYASRAKAAHFTTAPDQVCYAVGDAAGVVAADKAAMTLLSWKVE